MLPQQPTELNSAVLLLLLVLGLLVRESFSRPVCDTSRQSRVPRLPHFNLRRELSQFMADHFLCYPHIVIDLAVVHLEDESDEVGENGCAAGLSLDWRCALSWLCANDGETRIRSC